MLRKRLGLDLLAGGVDLGMDELVDDRDLIVNQSSRPKLGAIGKQRSTEVCFEIFEELEFRPLLLYMHTVHELPKKHYLDRDLLAILVGLSHTELLT